ncbi:MAG: UDP-N-acetylmuramate dehydrogenase [bacterium]|uniref:UDP-N-acetylenolpyruvoylglucosamine reductase n=2 Tax=Bacteria candidate phyla TaxID=1783234 RepID=A0A101I3C8_UNCT6|nr:MAG: UDP-N-acetylenolpyruvoylglucosamine reductase [candidate division TA06 bacterium 32_111]KUK87905.1 MAG: UDP-N-acetylenolpyruvoylglucosamine reductase [candidate division TA06 bacterium 34_109]MDI6700566.1 UDP-N-acetylmuramate dehydrogenase [bacterium]HAF08058.1 UDP-N-acetylenolpyruvoylglucosamine reductase [candidate division WOR-3 bacterium]HCP16241.1 UDP-N-acetylenolpyruvoylglucosamine reductase [candidate division WOR-3 bacterium]
MKIYNDFDFSKISYIRIGHVGKLFVIENIDDLLQVNDLKGKKVLGNCSKILFSKKNYRKNFYKLSGEFLKIEKLNNETVLVGAGVKFSTLMNFMIKENFTGFEELVGIPGTVGGMIKMNAGAFGKNISNNLITLETLDGKKDKSEICFSYRNTDIESVITFAKFSFEKSTKSKIMKKIEKFIKLRKRNQPYKAKTLGSTFKNPSPDQPAWKLIDNVGLRGFCVNDICVSTKHSNFIINRGKGNGKDFLELVSMIKKKVYDEKKIKLELEVEIL